MQPSQTVSHHGWSRGGCLSAEPAKSTTGVWRVFWVQHAVGMFGQIAAGLPLLIITALISHTHGLARAGQFTVVIGISAAVYSIALWEFRSYVVLNGFNRFSPLDYIAARGIALVAATITTICATL